jgi:hypothetical protein
MPSAVVGSSGRVPGQGVEVEGVKKVKKAPMLSGIYKKGPKNRRFPTLIYL